MSAERTQFDEDCARVHRELFAAQRARVYVKATVAEAERLPSGRWLVKGRGWLAKGVEFSDEDFKRNFEAI